MICCPKCGFEQPESTDCIHCGIHFRKYVELQARRRLEDPASTDSQLTDALRTGRTSRLVRGKDASLVSRRQRGRFVRISRARAQDIYVGFGQLLQAGMSPVQACSTIRESAAPSVAEELDRVQLALETGCDVPTAFARAPRLFSRSDVSVLTAFNDVGDAAAGFQSLAEHVDDVVRFRRTLIRGLVYPLAVVLVAIVVLPLPLLVSRGASAYFSVAVTRLGFFAVGLLSVFWLLPMVGSTQTIARSIRSVAWRLPWPATIWTNHVRAVFHRTLATSIGSGLELAKALRSAAAATNDESLMRRIGSAVVALPQTGLAKPLVDLGLVRAVDLVVLTSGERSGALVESLSVLSARYHTARNAGLTWFNRVIACVVTAIMVVVIALSIIDTYRGITRQTDTILDAIGSDAESLDVEWLKDMDVNSFTLPGAGDGLREMSTRGGSRR